MEQLIPLVITMVMVIFSLVVGLFVTVVSLAIPGFILYRLWSANQANSKLLQTGMAASAQVVSIAQTGMLVNHNPQCHLVLEVQPADGGPPFQAQTTTVISLVALARVQPGAVVDVRYDPEDRSKVAIASY